MNVPYPNCMAIAPVLTTIVAVKDGLCYPFNGPRAVPAPFGSLKVSKPQTMYSSYFDEQIYDGGPINRSTLYVLSGTYGSIK